MTIEEAREIYVASRASIPERPAMWRRLREQGWNITSTWIDEAGEGETANFSELWQRITDEIRRSVGVVLYVEPEDLPLKGAYIEIGMALGMGKPVAVVARDMPLDARNYRPLGSWAMHPLVVLVKDLESARHSVLARSACEAGERPCGDEMPPEIKSLISLCEANVKSFDNDQMSEALYFAEKMFIQSKFYAERWQAVLNNLGGSIVQTTEGTTYFGVTLPSPPVVPYRNTVAEFKAAIDAAMKGVRG
jgi:hypothetical protein